MESNRASPESADPLGERGAPAKQGISIADRIARNERDPGRAAALARARQSIAQKLDSADDASFALATLRLSKGLSQVRLAELMGMAQPQLARVEAGVNVNFETVERLAVALGASVSVVAEAVGLVRAAKRSSE